MRRLSSFLILLVVTVALGGTACNAVSADSTVFCNDMTGGVFKAFTLPSPAAWVTVGGASVGYASCDASPGFPGAVHALHSFNNGFYRIDTASGTETYIGQAVPYGEPGEQSWNGMAWSPVDGKLYATSYGFYGAGNASLLYVIDMDTGAAALIGPVSGASGLLDIAAHPSDGFLYGLDWPGNLVRIDPATAETALVGPAGFAAQYGQDMDFDDATGTLYLAAYNETAVRGELRTADLATGNTTLVEAFPDGHQVDCMSIIAAPCSRIPDGIVSWWPGDGDATDLAGDHDAALVGSVSYAPGMVGEAFSLAGGYVDVPTMTALPNQTSLTVSAWIRHDGGNARIVDKITVGGQDGFLFDILGGRLRFLVEDMSADGSTTIPTGQFVHVAAVNDGSSLKIYLNGVLDGSHGMSMIFPVNSLPLRIGADREGGSVFLGLIDELQVFDRGLTAAEIAAIVQAGSDGLCRAGADVALEVSDAPDPAPVGSTVTWTLVVGNNGLETAEGVVLVDSLPAGMTFASVSPEASCVQDAGTVTCDLGSLDRGESVAVTVSAVPGAAGTAVNLVSVTTSSLDPDMGNNAVEETTTVVDLHSIKGRVRTISGVPLSGASLRLFRGGSLVASARTGVKGRYAITGIASGTYTLKPRKRGWAFTPAKRTVTVTDADVLGRGFTASPR